MTKYTKIPTSLITNEKLTATEKIVMIYLCMCSGNKKKCFPSLRRIAKDIRIAESTAVKATKKLEAYGLVKKEFRYNTDGGKTSNLYFITNEAY